MFALFFFQPQNILLTHPFPKGDIKLCDLGFACLVNTGEDIRDIIGTVDYVGKNDQIIDKENQTICHSSSFWPIFQLSVLPLNTSLEILIQQHL